ncbi:hypothetical protein EGW08_018719 [Elysia chlorotica]|uniref:Uncharacterized protein n=1 Tax=Elysia chlorotica TaxID=188477 RepID=A0A3S1B111_ELYCH|nr:hypothetical protein EGW08_018719 [Elysia chlorotica]
MAYKDSFGFTHLVEDSDDDDQALDLSNSHLDVDLQPHLSSLETATSITGHVTAADDFENPELQPPEHNTEIVGTSKIVSLSNGIHSSSTSEEEGEESTPSGMDSVSSSNNASNNADAHVNGSSVEEQLPETLNVAPVQTNVQVQFSNSKGEVQVVQQSTSTRPDGSYYINTHGVPQQWSEPERPLRKRKILMIKIFSIVACVFFFPSGIPAAYYAFQIDKEFNEGILRGNIDKAQKLARRSEKLIVLSIVMSVVVATLIVALIKRPYSGASHHHPSGVNVG